MSNDKLTPGQRATMNVPRREQPQGEPTPKDCICPTVHDGPAQRLDIQKDCRWHSRFNEPASPPAAEGMTARDAWQKQKEHIPDGELDDAWIADFAEAYAAQKVRECVTSYQEMLRAAHAARDAFEADVDKAEAVNAKLRQERDAQDKEIKRLILQYTVAHSYWYDGEPELSAAHSLRG